MRRFILVILLTVTNTTAAFAEGDAFDTPEDVPSTHSDLFIPAVSFILPGFGQWTAGQYGHATVYSGVALGGFIYGANASRDIDEHDRDDKDALASKRIAVRKYTLGLQTYQSMGGFSMYHSFRTAVRKRQADGEYKFLTSDPQPVDLALAPFHFQYLARPTTYIPLVIGLGLNMWIVRQDPPDDYVKDSFRREDAAFTSGFSYNAGTHEELMFRGWLMPALHEYGMNKTWSNATQAALFGAAHLSNTPVPLVQFLLGWHFGSITQQDGWNMGESIFIHAWWDVFAFAAQYHFKQKEPNSKAVARLHLPPLTYAF